MGRLASGHRMHFVKVQIQVHRYCDGSLAIFLGPRKLSEYDAEKRRDPPRIKVSLAALIPLEDG